MGRQAALAGQWAVLVVAGLLLGCGSSSVSDPPGKVDPPPLEDTSVEDGAPPDTAPEDSDSQPPPAGPCEAPGASADPCDDGDPCTHNDSCVDGLCVGTPIAHESPVCDGVDEDCDGQTDENCSLRLHTQHLGDGQAVSEGPGFRVIHRLGSPRFGGSAAGPSFRVHAHIGRGEK